MGGKLAQSVQDAIKLGGGAPRVELAGLAKDGEMCGGAGKVVCEAGLHCQSKPDQDVCVVTTTTTTATATTTSTTPPSGITSLSSAAFVDACILIYIGSLYSLQMLL